MYWQAWYKRTYTIDIAIIINASIVYKSRCDNVEIIEPVQKLCMK